MSELDDIRADVREIKKMLSRPTPRPDDLVDASYIAARTTLSERTIKEGKAGTNVIPRVHLKAEGSKRPVVRFPRAAADKFVADLVRAAQSPKERALRLIERPQRSRRIA